MKQDPKELDLWRSALSRGASGPDLWRSVRDLANPPTGGSETPEFAEGADSPPSSDIGRRELFSAISKREELANIPFDRRNAASALRMYLGEGNR